MAYEQNQQGNQGSIHPRTPPRPHILVNAVANESPRFAAMVVLVTSNGCPKVVTSNLYPHQYSTSSFLSNWSTYMLRPAPSSRLLNLTGFFSGTGLLAATTDIVGGICVFGALTKG